jgi:hypothetical protein
MTDERMQATGILWTPSPRSDRLGNRDNREGGTMRTVLTLAVVLAFAAAVRPDEREVFKRLEIAGVTVHEGSAVAPEGWHMLRFGVLDFEGVEGTDVLLGEVCEARSIEGLFLRKSDLSDAGMSSISGLKWLQYLDLRSTGITDAGLRRLEGLKKLTTLRLETCPAITDEGVARLQKALPRCKICR